MKTFIISPYSGITKLTPSRSCLYSDTLIIPRQIPRGLGPCPAPCRLSIARRQSAKVSARPTTLLYRARGQTQRFLTSFPSKPSPPLYRGPGHQPHLYGSSGSLLAALTCAFAVLVAANWLLGAEDTQISSESARFEPRMASLAGGPGHLGNLTPDQDAKLKQLWARVLNICAVDLNPPFSPENVKGAAGGSDLASLQAKGEPKPPHSSDNDKHGLTTQYRDLLANSEPEDIRRALWDLIKHDHPDALLLRFLRARKWDVDKALVMLMSALNWRNRTMKVDEDIMTNGEGGAVASEKSKDRETSELGRGFMTQCRMGKSFLHGVDREGRPICVVRVRLHRASDQSAASLERYTVYIIETARLALKGHVETANIIFDMTDFRLANMDYHPVKFMIQCFEANYPESLGVVLVHNAPWVFQGIWKIIRGWLDPVVASKVHFTNHRAGLEPFIDPCQLIRELGGDEQWEYEYIEPIAGENDKMEDIDMRNQLSTERQKLHRQFEANTSNWIMQSGDDKSNDVSAERVAIAEKIRENYWIIDPYVRARSLYDRRDIIRPGGNVDWYRYKDEGTGSARPR